MRPIDVCRAQLLRWTQPRAGRSAYQLWVGPQGPERAERPVRAEATGTERVAILRWQRGAQAVAEAAPGRWTFRRAGFWHPRVIVSLAGSDRAVAVFTARWTGTGTLELSAGRQVHWSAAHAWQADDGTPLVAFTSRQGLITLEGTVALTPFAVGAPDLALLVLLGWYLVVLQVRDTHTMTAALVAATT